MKELKCPLCGKFYTLSTYGFNPHLNKIEAYSFECKECGYGFDRRKSYEGAVSAAEEFISKFPPIMRLKPGDKIRHIHQFNSYRGTPEVVEKVDVQSGFIKVRNRSSLLRPSSITFWPWELEQKGGQQ